MGYELIKDLENGRKNEKLVVYYLNKNVYPEDNFKLYRNNKKEVDYRNSLIVGECKGRFCKYEAYQETFFGYNKLEYLIKKKEPRLWKFYFLFTNGLYVWSYRENEFSVRPFYHKEKGMVNQVYVNIKYLEKLTSTINSNTWLPEDINDYLGQLQERDN
tara:strand:- start:2869 stop:3345 length:477 start_codon:yes stop_codon:yes gene_type:complete